MMRRTLRTVALIGAATLALVTVVAGSASAELAPAIILHSTNTAVSGPLVVGIGDSIFMGHGLDPDQAWLAVLAKSNGWRLTNLASDGSGFVTAGDNHDTFADQVAAATSLHPDVIVISGSSNDLGATNAQVMTATSAAINALHLALPATKIIAVSAVWGDTALPPQLKSITADVATAVAAVGGSYLQIHQPLAGKSNLMQPDDVHPTAAGQRVLAAAVQRAIARHGLDV